MSISSQAGAAVSRNVALGQAREAVGGKLVGGWYCFDFYHDEGRILGADSRKLGLVASSAILDRLAPLFDNGMIEAPLVNRALPLARGIEAYQGVAAGAQGRTVIEP